MAKGPVVPPPPPPPPPVDGTPLHAAKRNASNMRQAGEKTFAADFMIVSLLCYMLQRLAQNRETPEERPVSRCCRTGDKRGAMCQLRFAQYLLRTGKPKSIGPPN